MNLALVLHMYQPSFQDPKVFRKIADASYLPLVRFLKNNKHASVTLSIPLSTIYQLHKHGYSEFLDSIKELSETGSIELVSSAAYHALLPKMPDWAVEKQILLNEYGLGFYFGNHKGFEGEDAILVKNVRGFFPPELAVSESVVRVLNDLGYEWVLVDSVAVEKRDKAFLNLEDSQIKIAVRHTGLSNLISFKRDTDVHDILSEAQKIKDIAVVALDAEYFGHHYKEGIYVLEGLLSECENFGINMTTVSQAMGDGVNQNVNNIAESTWGASLEDISDGNIYPFWVNSGSEVQDELWNLLNEVLENYKPETPTEVIENLGAFPIWDTEKLGSIQNEVFEKDISKELLVLQLMNSDQFWWASKKEIMGKNLYNPEIIREILAQYEKYARIGQDTSGIAEKVAEIEGKL
ncbi:hypothetical protein ACFL13_00535 [Patescibacteria group bacterium]